MDYTETMLRGQLVNPDSRKSDGVSFAAWIAGWSGDATKLLDSYDRNMTAISAVLELY